MITYSLIQYDVLNSVMNPLQTPSPGLADLLQGKDLSNPDIKDILQNIKFNSRIPLPQSTYEGILDFLNTVTELDLTNSKTIILKIELDDEEITGNVDIISKNLNGKNTYITKSGFLIPIPIFILFKTLGNCRSCLKLTFKEDNDYNFTGNLGASYLGSFKNGQKQYSFFLPDFSQAAVIAGTYGTAKEYIMYWNPLVNTTYIDQSGQTQTVTGNRWVATPSSSISTFPFFNSEAFFHRNTFISGSPIQKAACPYYKSNPPNTSPYFNFGGNTGNFLVEGYITEVGKPCSTFRPTTGSVIFGYACNQQYGCIPAPSGSVEFTTFESCSAVCQQPSTGSEDTGSYGWACITPSIGFSTCISVTSSYAGGIVYPTQQLCLEKCEPNYGYNCYTFTGQCIPGSITNTGSFANLIECQASGCGSFLPTPTTCSCVNNIIFNSNFGSPTTNNNNSNIAGWAPSYIPTSGNWNFNNGYAQSTVFTQFNNNAFGFAETSSMYLGMGEILNVSCSYSLCFQAWQTTDVPSSTIIFDPSVPFPGQPPTGSYPVPNSQIFTNLTSVPTAYTCNFVAGSPNFRFYLGVNAGQVGRINIDNVCIKWISNYYVIIS